MSVARLNEQLCFALYSASNRVTSIYRPILDKLGLTYTQFMVLMTLWEEDGISISLLADRTALSKATMTPLLKRLEQKGLIERQRLLDNERQKSVVLTDAGRDLSLKSEAITQQAFCQTHLSKEEAQTMIALCQKITR